MPTDRELDQLIDAALPSYSDAEPTRSLEHRILARALAEPPTKRLFWAWTLAIPALTCLLTFLILRAYHPTLRSVPASARTTDAETTTPTRTAPGISTENAPSLLQPRATHARPVMPSPPREPLPKQDIFPSPSPLTAEEQTLVALSRAQLQTLSPTPASDVDIDPIHVAELKIKPLTIPALDTPGSSGSESGRNDQQP